MVNAFQIVGGVLVAGGAGIFVYLGIDELKRRRAKKGTIIQPVQQTTAIQPQKIIIAPTVSIQNQQAIEQLNQMIARTLDWWNYFLGCDEVMKYIQKFDLGNPNAFRMPPLIPLNPALRQSLLNLKVPQQIVDYIERIRPFIAGHLCVLLSVRDALRQGQPIPLNLVADRNLNFGKQIANAQRQLMPYLKMVNLNMLLQQGLWKKVDATKQYLIDPRVTVDLMLRQKA